MPDGGSKSLPERVLYAVRNLRSRRLFDALQRHVHGLVLDVGGADFVATVIARDVPFDRWITVERHADQVPVRPGARTAVVCSDGCQLGIATASVDTVVNLQVLEHVFEPIRMVEEIARVLRPGGCGIFLIPATSTMHLAPHFHSNFSRFWILEAMERADLEVLRLDALGGIWSSMASHLVYFFFQAARARGMSDPEIRRRPAFYALLPLQALYALISIPITLVLSLGDLAEEPNNHLVVVRKR
jgi:SAM-dependent methyltransferase